MIRRAEIRTESGAALVEATIALTLLLMLTFALMDVGMYFAGRSSVGDAGRGGARSAAIAGSDPSADYLALASMQRSLSELRPDALQRVVIFKANSYKVGDAAPCLTGPSSVVDSCNVYLPSDLARPESDWSSTSAWSAPLGWPSTSRAVSRSAGTDLVGIAVTARIDTPVGIFGGTEKTVTRVRVVQIEPEEG